MSAHVYDDDSRPRPERRLTLQDQGVVLPYGRGRRNAITWEQGGGWVFEHERNFFMYYDGARPKDWRVRLAVSDNLTDVDVASEVPVLDRYHCHLRRNIRLAWIDLATPICEQLTPV